MLQIFYFSTRDSELEISDHRISTELDYEDTQALTDAPEETEGNSNNDDIDTEEDDMENGKVAPVKKIVSESIGDPSSATTSRSSDKELTPVSLIPTNAVVVEMEGSAGS